MRTNGTPDPGARLGPGADLGDIADGVARRAGGGDRVFAARGGYAPPTAFAAGFGPAMGACAGLALLGAASGLVIPSRWQPNPTTPATPATSVQNDAPKIETRR